MNEFATDFHALVWNLDFYCKGTEEHRSWFEHSVDMFNAGHSRTLIKTQWSNLLKMKEKNRNSNKMKKKERNIMKGVEQLLQYFHWEILNVGALRVDGKDTWKQNKNHTTFAFGEWE